LVTAVAFSPNGQHIVSGSDNGTIKLWDTARGELQKTLAGHSGWVRVVAFSPDGRHIASGSGDRTVKLWDTTRGELQQTLAGHSDWVTAVAFSPDGRYIASGSNDRTVKLWDTARGELQKTLAGHSHSVRAVAFSPDGRHIASGSNDRTVKLWDTAKLLKVSKYVGRTLGSRFKFRSWQEIKTSAPIRAVKFSRGNQYLSTNIGPISLGNIPPDKQVTNFDALKDLYFGNQWIYYGVMRLLHLSSDFQPECYDIQGNKLAIGFRNGQVWSFDIDRSSLQRTLGDPSL
jgi:WD40 repeat protein